MNTPEIVMRDVRKRLNVKTTADEIDDRCEKWIQKLIHGQLETEISKNVSVLVVVKKKPKKTEFVGYWVKTIL